MSGCYSWYGLVPMAVNHSYEARTVWRYEVGEPINDFPERWTDGVASHERPVG